MIPKSKEKKLVSAVIYLHNDHDRIVSFLTMVSEVLGGYFEDYEIIVVNDCSQDASVAEIKEHFNHSAITIINLSLHHGLEVAMTAGIDLSMGDFVYEFDDLTLDFQPSLIIDLYKNIVKGFDIVSAAPSKRHTFFSRLFYSLFNRYSKSKYVLRSERFRILSRRAINRVYSMSKAIPYRKAIYANSGLKMDMVNYNVITENSLQKRKQKMDFRNHMAINSLIIYTNLAFRISMIITIVLLSLTFCSGIYAFWVYFGEQPIEGWTTTMLLMAGSFSGLFFILAIIIKYLSLIVELIYSQKSYLVESIEKT